ncbi:MAG TPA: hypothetical protein ENK55_08915 [Actinobacteria bacterium]|nr:hypothetical protein [Actinomycetota bacterium]
MSETLTGLIEASDLVGLVAYVERLVREGDWDGLVELRDRCREAVERGKQVWGPAEYAEYRLALDAPAAYAGRVVAEGKGRYGHGPLWEVAASTHRFSDLAPHLESPRVRALVAHERVIRGEEIDEGAGDPVIPLPLRLGSWEPTYAVADYGPDRVDFPEPGGTEPVWEELGDAGEPIPDDGPAAALLELVRPWWDESSGKAECVAVAGDARGAIRALGPRRVRISEVSATEAVAHMAWAAASGGAYGRRRGTPIGRLNAWWVVAELLGYEDLPDDPEVFAEELGELRWYRWDPGDRIGGWGLHVAIEDPAEGFAWALSAVDAR